MERSDQYDGELLQPEVMPSGGAARASEMLKVRRLVKAIASGETNPNRLAELAGFESATRAMLTLDKIQNRREIMDAFNRAGISMDYIVSRVKHLCDSDSDSSVRDGLNILIKMTGIDKGEAGESHSRSWEDMLIGKTEEPEAELGDGGQYLIDIPDVPEEELQRRLEDEKLARELFA
jgi:hypothetical protein